ncbi:34377_t:CDS:2 [Racocetra persica]|uniref:34377_t:CDS:1 n=1 Tax=Racocetra persica TaxID=160502 RepID=A0ACA9KER5_9GLOM|nr:34377_t:CDS:2 [Racocetra persica]
MISCKADEYSNSAILKQMSNCAFGAILICRIAITQGLPKVKQILDNIKPEKDERSILAQFFGEIVSVEKKIKQKNEESGEVKTYPLGMF